MTPVPTDAERPETRAHARRRAHRLEIGTVAFLCSNVVLLYLAMGSSQAMKTAWIDDMLSLVPPVMFLVADRIRRRPPTRRFPYGFHRAVSLAFLLSAFALFVMGALLLGEAVVSLARGHRPTIAMTSVLGVEMWEGWPMIAVAVWSGIPAAILARKKLPLARALNNAVLHADADMGKADWLVSLATVLGVLGIGFGLWWADATAAALISLDILWDGAKNVRRIFTELVDRIPETVDSGDEEPIVEGVASYLRGLSWITAFDVRLHQRGDTFVGDVTLVPADERDLSRRVEETITQVRSLDWRLSQITLTPLPALPEGEGGVRWQR